MDVRRLALCFLTLALIAPVLPAAAAVDMCLTGASAGQDRVDILAVRGDVEATCPCDAATSHPSYVACARGVAKAAVTGLTLRNKCLGTVIRIEKRSTCGSTGRVACLQNHPGAKHPLGCRVIRVAGCVDRPSEQRTACPAATHCIDAGDS